MQLAIDAPNIAGFTYTLCAQPVCALTYTDTSGNVRTIGDVIAFRWTGTDVFIVTDRVFRNGFE